MWREEEDVTVRRTVRREEIKVLVIGASVSKVVEK